MKDIFRHKNRSIPVLMIVVSLLLGGCSGTLEIHQAINSNGSATGYMNGTFDLTEVYTQQGATYTNYPVVDTEAKGPICKQITEFINGTDVTCDLKNAILTFKGTKDAKKLNESEGYTIKQGWFVKEYLYLSNSTGLSSGNESSGPNITQLADFRAKGAKINLVIEMPGDIIEVVGGKMVKDGNGKTVAQIDVIDVLMQGGTISIRSREFTGLLGYIIVGALALILAAPLLSWLLNRGEKPLYREKPGTLMLMLFYLPFSLVMFCASAVGFFSSGAESQTLFIAGASFFSMAFVFYILEYLGSGFAVTQKGITYKTMFAKKTISLSQIKKIERAKAGIGLSGYIPAYMVSTTSGTKIKPTWLERGNGRRWHKGVLITLKDGSTLYYPVRDIGWVIDTVKGRN